MQDKKEKQLKTAFYVCVAIYVITLMISFYHNFTTKDMEALGMTFVAMLTPLIVPVIFKLFHFKPVYEIYIVSTVFTYFASLLGSGFHWYSYTGFDKVLHFSSGWFLTTVAVILYYFVKKTNKFADKTDYHIFLIFINAVNLSAAALWEFYEYGMLIFFNNDCINHYTQGVHDSMTDMLCAFVAGIMLTLLIVHYHKTGKGNFFIHVYEKFYDRNIAQK